MSIAVISSQSGLNAASARLAASANNVANQGSTAATNQQGVLVNEPFRAQRVEQASIVPAGVQARVTEASNPTTRRFDPQSPVADESGFVDAPNVSIDEEIIQQQISTYDFRANLRALEAQDESLQSLIDITT
jgi:flagellar basal-body rod protein FlgC